MPGDNGMNVIGSGKKIDRGMTFRGIDQSEYVCTGINKSVSIRLTISSCLLY